jgi:hypothetical protein
MARSLFVLFGVARRRQLFISLRAAKDGWLCRRLCLYAVFTIVAFLSISVAMR